MPLFHDVVESDLKPGDHIYAPRLGYTHHGIVVERNPTMVIDAGSGTKKDPLIRKIPLAEFAKGKELKRAQYNEKCWWKVRGSYQYKPYPPEKVVERANEYHDKIRGSKDELYKLWDGNCEHFAVCMKCGVYESQQVKAAIRGIGGAISTTTTQGLGVGVGITVFKVAEQAMIKVGGQGVKEFAEHAGKQAMIEGAEAIVSKGGQQVATASLKATATGAAVGAAAGAAVLCEAGLFVYRYHKYKTDDNYSLEDLKHNTKKSAVSASAGLIGSIAFCWCPPAAVVAGILFGVAGSFLADKIFGDVDTDVKKYSLIAKFTEIKVNKDSSASVKRDARHKLRVAQSYLHDDKLPLGTTPEDKKKAHDKFIRLGELVSFLDSELIGGRAPENDGICLSIEM
jgi:hypothetical protein